jgi:ribose 5-phosphate isomerase B
MKIALGSDHHGVRTVRTLIEHLRQLGHDAEVFGRCDGASCDYPVSAALVAHEVAEGRADAGVLVCGSGIGISIAANKVDGIRAALVHDVRAAEMSRRHNDANVLCLSGATDPADAVAMLDVFLTTAFEGGRHARRVGQITDIERGHVPAEPMTEC